MAYNDEPKDEDWYVDDEADEADPIPCPECGQDVPEFLDKCPACGYWLSAFDRRRLRPRESKPMWVLATAFVLIVVLILSLPGVWRMLFN